MAERPKTPYRYPDQGDRLTREGIEQAGQAYRRYFAASEQQVLAGVRHRLLELAPRRALDAGCGEGRLLPWLTGLGAAVTALEPDRARMAEARQAAATLVGRRIELVEAALEDFFASRPFDLVVCAHVLQHLSTDRAPPAIHRLRQLTRPGGLLLLVTAQSADEADRFDVTSETTAGPRARLITAAEFDRLIERPDLALLPTRRFGRSPLRELLSGAGFLVLETRGFHVDVGPFARMGGLTDPDRVLRVEAERPDCPGADLMVLARAS